MSWTLFRKVFRDLRWGLVFVALLLAVSQIIRAKITDRITNELIPELTKHIGFDKLIDILFKGTGKLLETEREVHADATEFTGKAKVRLDAAMKTALDKHPGTIMKIEYEIENSGSVAYEFDIKTADGKTLEVEVDAVTGKLSDPEEVLFQVGK